MSRKYGSSSYMKVIWSRSRSQKSKKMSTMCITATLNCVRSPQCKNSIANNSASRTQSGEVCVQHIIFGYGGSNSVTAILVT